MKKVNLLWALVLLLCLSSCNSEPKDAKECVLQFLQCLEDGDTEKGKRISVSYQWENSNDIVTAFDIAQKYNPHWESKKVVISEEYVNRYSDFEVVDVQYNGSEVSFYVQSYYDNKRNKNLYRVYDFDNFLNIDTATLIKNGVEMKRGNNAKKDIHFLMYTNVENVISFINEFNQHFKKGEILLKLYPKAKAFEDYLAIDSIVPQIQNIIINMNDKTGDLQNYAVNCTNGNVFYVKPNNNSYIIINSKGLYDSNKRIADIQTEYNYEYKPSSSLKTDIEMVEAVAQAEQDIQEKIRKHIAEEERRKAEEERRVYQQSRVNYYKRIGLVIKDIRMVRGKDKDGDPTKGIDIEIFNPTNKTIKYLVIYAAAVNKVNDVMRRKTCRGIGPIEPQRTVSYSFDDLFYDYNDIIDDISASIELIYTDGSRKSVKWKDAKATSDGFDEDWWYN